MKSLVIRVDSGFVDISIALTPVPQVGQGFNRDYWERFERFVRDLTKKGSDDVYVVTGPLWMPRPDGDGKWIMQHPCIGEGEGEAARAVAHQVQ